MRTSHTFQMRGVCDKGEVDLFAGDVIDSLMGRPQVIFDVTRSFIT